MPVLKVVDDSVLPIPLGALNYAVRLRRIHALPALQQTDFDSAVWPTCGAEAAAALQTSRDYHVVAWQPGVSHRAVAVWTVAEAAPEPPSRDGSASQLEQGARRHLSNTV